MDFQHHGRVHLLSLGGGPASNKIPPRTRMATTAPIAKNDSCVQLDSKPCSIFLISSVWGPEFQTVFFLAGEETLHGGTTAHLLVFFWWKRYLLVNYLPWWRWLASSSSIDALGSLELFPTLVPILAGLSITSVCLSYAYAQMPSSSLRVTKGGHFHCHWPHTDWTRKETHDRKWFLLICGRSLWGTWNAFFPCAIICEEQITNAGIKVFMVSVFAHSGKETGSVCCFRGLAPWGSGWVVPE